MATVHLNFLELARHFIERLNGRLWSILWHDFLLTSCDGRCLSQCIARLATILVPLTP